MSTYEELQDQACADGIDVMDYNFNSPNIKGLYCNSTVAINKSIWRNGYTIPFSWSPTPVCQAQDKKYNSEKQKSKLPT